MNTLLAISIAVATAFSAPSVGHDSSDPVAITIQAKDSSGELYVQVDSQAEGNVTISVFSETGEIVVNDRLAPGGNNIKVKHLRPGRYIAVVRHNDEFRTKQEFKVN